MSVVSEAGTDLRCPLGEFPAISEYGFVDEPGRWDHWPSGFVLTWPNEGGARGKIVIDVGDILLPQKLYALGHRADRRERLRHAHRRRRGRGTAARVHGVVQDPEAYAISHIGWGLQPRAHWTTLGLYDREATIGMDARAYEGNFLFSLGPNNEAGGSRTTCHIDIPRAAAPCGWTERRGAPGQGAGWRRPEGLVQGSIHDRYRNSAHE